MLIIGITGTIGSGKSTVAGFLRELGAQVIDADEVGHEIYLPGTLGWKAVVEGFGEDIVASGGTIDRRKLGEIVFKDPAALEKLNRIVRPLITAEVQVRLKGLHEKGTSVAVLEAALLIEAGWTPLVNEVWVTTAPEQLIYKRLTAARKYSRDQIHARIQAQLPVTEQIKLATRVIDTDAPIDKVKAVVSRHWQTIDK